MPLAVFAQISDEGLSIQALVGEPDGSRVLRAQKQGAVGDLSQLVESLADDLLQQGASQIIARA